VSYEILEDIQDLHRGHYGAVTDNIGRMLAAGVAVTTNSVITPTNVRRMEEMVRRVIERLPGLDYLSFEPVMALNEWSAELADNEFYELFTEHFDVAGRVAEAAGVELTCSVLRNVDCVVERYCAGELALCPEGSITVCPCVSSPSMAHYDDYVYGRVTPDGAVLINETKLNGLLADDLHSRPECGGCFARWNCGGGCVNSAKLETALQRAVKCRFVRNFTKRELWRRTKEEYEKSQAKTIDEILR
jgi:radical SAM protein with 4Fe4S-binding SPASM domain